MSIAQQIIIFMRLLIFSLTLCLLVQCKVELSPTIEISNAQILTDPSLAVVFSDHQLNQAFNDSVFLSELNCRNNNLEVINFNSSDRVIFKYANIDLSSLSQIAVTLFPNQEPTSYIDNLTPSTFELVMNCSQPYNSRNYFNQITISLNGSLSFSFLLDCDPSTRHKQFEVGYVLLALINAGIIVGVAMYSHVWSIRINFKPLQWELKWLPFLVFSALGDAAIIILLKLGYNQSGKAFLIIRYLGIIVSIPFTFLCLNEILFIHSKLKQRIYKFIRWCDLISCLLALIMGTLAFFFENWIYYDVLAGFICVGSIKIFHFDSLKQAFASMTILFLAVTLLTVVLHFLLTISYNDYAGELSSPLFLQVPDLVYNLFKKCSWLPILDVILPGVTLSYLRVHDSNKSSKWGGIYTVTGNLSFILATVIWIGVQLIYPYSVPFSLVSYPFLMLTIFVVAWRRAEWQTLFQGIFLKEDPVDEKILHENRQSLGDHISGDDFSELLIKSQEESPNNSSILSPH